MKIIFCLRKGDHVLIPNWGSVVEDAVAEIEMLVALGWEPSQLTAGEIVSLRINLAGKG